MMSRLWWVWAKGRSKESIWDIPVVRESDAGGCSWGGTVKVGREGADRRNVLETALWRPLRGRVCVWEEEWGVKGLREEPTSRQVWSRQVLPLPITGDDLRYQLASHSSLPPHLQARYQAPKNDLHNITQGRRGDKVRLGPSFSCGPQSAGPSTIL